jgi:hypothetical protein
MRLTHKQNPQYLEKRVNLLALQLFGFDRLGDEVVAAMLEGLDVAEPGHKNNRRQRQAVAHLPAAFETVHHRIHQHHVSRFKFSI